MTRGPYGQNGWAGALPVLGGALLWLAPWWLWGTPPSAPRTLRRQAVPRVSVCTDGRADREATWEPHLIALPWEAGMPGRWLQRLEPGVPASVPPVEPAAMLATPPELDITRRRGGLLSGACDRAPADTYEPRAAAARVVPPPEVAEPSWRLECTGELQRREFSVPGLRLRDLPAPASAWSVRATVRVNADGRVVEVFLDEFAGREEVARSVARILFRGAATAAGAGGVGGVTVSRWPGVETAGAE